MRASLFVLQCTVRANMNSVTMAVCTIVHAFFEKREYIISGVRHRLACLNHIRSSCVRNQIKWIPCDIIAQICWNNLQHHETVANSQINVEPEMPTILTCYHLPIRQFRARFKIFCTKMNFGGGSKVHQFIQNNTYLYIPYSIAQYAQ